jgi:hypothetical protein
VTNDSEAVSVGERFVLALSPQAWANLAGCFHEEYVQRWFGDIERMDPLCSGFRPES